MVVPLKRSRIVKWVLRNVLLVAKSEVEFSWEMQPWVC